MDAPAIVALVISGLSLVLAGWATWTSHQARRWQQKRDSERRQTTVTVGFVHAADSPGNDYQLTVVLRNDGELTEWVTAAFIEEANRGCEGWRSIRIFGDEGGMTQHYRLEPRAQQSISVSLTDRDIDWMRSGFIVEAWLGSGKRITSDIEHLLEELLSQTA